MVIREEKIGNLKEILNKWYTTTEQYQQDKEELERQIKSALAESTAVHENLKNLNGKINSLIGFTVSLVETLPEEGEFGVIYLMKTKKPGKDYYEEYLWYEDEFYQIGEIDLSDYATNAALNQAKTDLSQTATSSRNGMMSSSDKSKLDGIATGANNYSLPTASSGTKGGVKVGNNLSMQGDTMNAKDTTYSDASTSSSGLMSAADKRKLNGIADGATAGSYTLPTASTTVKGGIKVGTGLSMNGDTLNCTVSGGGGSTGGSSYTLPVATNSQLGGVKVGSGLAITRDGVLSCTVSGGSGSGGGSSYTLPTASSSTKGGIKVGSGLKMDGETLNVNLGGGAGNSHGSDSGFNVDYYQNIMIISWWSDTINVASTNNWIKYKDLPGKNAGRTTWSSNLVNDASGTLYLRVANNSSKLEYYSTKSGSVPITPGQLVVRGTDLIAVDW